MEAAVQPVVTWMVNRSAVNTSLDWISTEGDTLTFSPLALSDTGRYTCELIATKDLTYYSIEAHGQSKEKYVAVLSKSYIEIFCASLHMYVYSLTVPVPDVVTTPSHTTPLYAGTSVTLTCTMTLHPNVDSGESVIMEWTVPSSLSSDQYSDTSLYKSGKIYTCNITISPLLIRHSGRYLCSVTVTGRNVNQATNTSSIDITVMSKLLICIYESFYSIPISLQLFHNNL